ncbi:hypothetical protein UY286_05210 [Paenibacillus polymyxa]|uniref:hypothetical protein n=1 Tax=Paenibacillus polymyxa TaxID=1406 RepID=UPI002AB43741|nr:hypothetical protein [Paenibacillus polymyxa]MDY7989806.1 hypothetical protein [Paenibacillus polymyxa]MDY8116835.1 hypothetical protein [Paenibacillus polymyxa]
MYFVNAEHQLNFQKLAEKFPGVRQNSEYRATCYIAAHPEIFKCFKLELQEHGPFDWYFDYLDNPDKFIELRNQGKTTGDTAPLTGQTIELVKLALNFWNGREFDLSSGIVSWDITLYQVAMQAIQLRRGGVF